MSSVSLAELKQVAQRARNPEWESHLNCGPINRGIASAFDKEGIECYVEEGMIAPIERRGIGPEHAYVVVPPEAVSESSSDVIVDGALSQFCEENKKEGLVSVAIAPRNEFDSVEVLTRSDDWYSWYTRGM